MASSRGIQGPKMGTPFWVLEMARTDTRTGYMSISLHPRYVRICAGIDPQNGDHFGGEMAVRL